MIFTGGLVGGIAISGIATVKCVLKSDYIRNGIKDEISNKIVTTLYGDEYRVTRGYNNRRVNYRDYYNDAYVRKYIFDEPIFDSRSNAETIREELLELFDEYGQVAVCNYKDLCGLTWTYKDNNYGWDKLGNVSVIRVRNGYKLSLPEPKLLDK